MARPRDVRHDQHGLIALVGASIVVRVAYLLEYSELPFLWGPLFDSRVYLRQAASIHSGKLGDPSFVAFSPLYGWFLALFGRSPLAEPVHAQLVLGCLNVVLIHRIGLRLGGRTTALVAGAAYSGYAVIVFHESKLLSETLALTLLLAALALWSSARFDRGVHRVAIGAGLFLGATALARSSVSLSLPFFVIAAALPWRGAPVLDARRRALRAGLVLVGALVPLMLNGAWNLAHTGIFVPVTLASSTIARTTSRSSSWTGDLRGLAVGGAAEVSPYDVVREARERIARVRRGEPDRTPLADADLMGWLRGAPAKIVETFADTETTSEYGYYGERSEITALRVLPLSFGALALVALAGAALLVRRHGLRALVPWLPLVIGTLAVTTLFHPSSRYRLPMVLPLLLLAGYAVAHVSRMRGNAWRVACGGMLALVVAGFAVRLWTYQLRAPGLWETRVAESAAARGDRAEALRRIERARRVAPNDPTVARSIDRIVHGRRRSDPPP